METEGLLRVYKSRHLSFSWARSIQATSPSQFQKIHLNVIPPLPRDLFPSGFPTKILYATSLSLIRATCPVHLILIDLMTRIILGEEYRPLSTSLCKFPYFPVTSSLSGPNILLRTLFSNTRSLRCSFSVGIQISHPYKTTGKIVVLYILIFKFLDSKLKDKRFCTEWYQAIPDFKLFLFLPE